MTPHRGRCLPHTQTRWWHWAAVAMVGALTITPLILIGGH
jgi:hypothetical protein